jgi:hypothetical protein
MRSFHQQVVAAVVLARGGLVLGVGLGQHVAAGVVCPRSAIEQRIDTQHFVAVGVVLVLDGLAQVIGLGQHAAFLVVDVGQQVLATVADLLGTPFDVVGVLDVVSKLGHH